MNKDWTGNSRSMYTTLGSSSHMDFEREQHDYYATEPRVIDELLQVEDFPGRVWEPACGEGHLSERLAKRGIEVVSSDLIDRGYGQGDVDFLTQFDPQPKTHIITNPPYKYAMEFVEKSLSLIDDGYKVAMFLKLTFLEGQARQRLFSANPPRTVYIYASRRQCAMNGNFDTKHSSAAAYAWFIWQKGFSGEPTIRWLP